MKYITLGKSLVTNIALRLYLILLIFGIEPHLELYISYKLAEIL